jgi:hypothetical protein
MELQNWSACGGAADVGETLWSAILSECVAIRWCCWVRSGEEGGLPRRS